MTLIIWTECREGWYGVNCKQQCEGHCREGTICYHVTGQCDRGCDAGWTGYMCDKCNFCNIICPLSLEIKLKLRKHNYYSIIYNSDRQYFYYFERVYGPCLAV